MYVYGYMDHMVVWYYMHSHMAIYAPQLCSCILAYNNQTKNLHSSFQIFIRISILMFQVNHMLQNFSMFSILTFLLLYSGGKMNWNQISGGSGRNFALPALKRYPNTCFYFSHHKSIITPCELVRALTLCSVFSAAGERKGLKFGCRCLLQASQAAFQCSAISCKV